MIAVTLLLVVIADTTLTGFLLAKYTLLKSQIATQAKVIRDLSDCLADMDEEVRDDAE